MLRKIFASRREDVTATGVNCIMRSFIIFAFYST
jgi:hypothetical protein